MTNEIIPQFDALSVAELDQKLEDAVVEHERSEQLICFGLLEMDERRGYEKFGFSCITDYAHARFDFSNRKTFYLLSLARRVRDYPQIEQALADGKIGWSKAYRIVRLAAAEDEVLSLESAMSMSVRELDRRIRKKLDDVVTKLRLWLSEDQSAVWEYALEVCRRVSGANLSPEQCLEYMAGEFLATWAFEANQEDSGSCNRTPAEAEALVGADAETVAEADTEETLSELMAICPETADLPSVSRVPHTKIARAVLERDGWQCTYPGCSARAKLHVHHIEPRSHFGTKSTILCNSLTNLTTLCVFHHRQLHARVLGVQGRAPFELEWRKPKLIETSMMRLERRRRLLERKEKKGAKPQGRAEPETPSDPIETSAAQLHTVALARWQEGGNELDDADEGKHPRKEPNEDFERVAALGGAASS